MKVPSKIISEPHINVIFSLAKYKYYIFYLYQNNL